MKPRQFPWKWLLLGLVVLLLVGLVALPNFLGRSSDLRDRVATELSAWTGATVTLTEPLSVRYFPPLSLRGGLVLSNATKLPLVKSITGKDVKISLSLSDLLMGRLRVDAMRLGRPKITLRSSDTASVSDQTPEALLANALAVAPVGVVRVRRGTIKTASGKVVASEFDARLDASDGGGSLSALGSFDFRGETVHFGIDSGQISQTEAGPTAPVTLRVTSDPVITKFSGTATMGDGLQLDGDMQAEMGNARRALNWLGIALPQGESLKGLSAAGTVHWSGVTLTFDDGAFTLDGNAADGLLAITVAERPRVEGTLAFERLVLDPYIGAKQTDEARSETALFDWALLKYLDADLRISAAQVSASAMKLGRGGFTVSAKDGVVSSEVGELELCGGQVEGRVGLDLSGSRTKASFAGNLTDVAIESCLQPFALGVPIKGVGRLKFDVSTGGTTVDELIRGLTGDLKIAAQNGAIPVDFPRLLAASSDLGRDGWSSDGLTPFDTLDAGCRLSAGHIWCQVFNMQTRRGRISGSGGVDVARQTLDWDFLIANPVAPLNASQLVMETPPRVTIRGSLTQPLIRRADRPTLGGGSTQASPGNVPVSPR
jgi:AsmA protein